MFDLNKQNDLKKIIQQINTPQNIERKEDIYDGHRIMNGDMKHYVKLRLKELWPESYKYFRLYTGSVTRQLDGKLSKAYQKKPLRKLDSKEESAKYDDILTAGKFHKAAQEYDSTWNLDEYACMWVNAIQNEDPETKIITRDYTFRALNQSEFDRIVNKQTLKTEVFIVSMPESLVLEQIEGDATLTDIQDEDEDKDNLAFYAIWTATQHVVVVYNKKNEKYKKLPIAGNTKGENPIGRIPAYFGQKKGEASVPPRPSVPFADLELAACRSVLLSGCDVNALGKLIIKHPEGQTVPKNLFDSPFTYLKLPQQNKRGDSVETSAEYINASPNIEEFRKVVNDFEGSILKEKGIGTESMGSQKFTSGEDRTVALKSELDIIESNQTHYCEMEEDVYDIIKSFEDAAESGMFRSDALVCGFPKHEPIQSRSSILDEIEKEMRLGTMEPWEKHVRLNPNLTEDEAKEKEQRIQDLRRNQFRNIVNNASSNNDEGSQEENATGTE